MAIFNNLYSSSYGFFGRIIIMTLATLLAAAILPGVSVASLPVAFLTAFVISLLDNLIRPGLIIITLPINFFTQGLFIFVINALVILLASALVGGFHVKGFWSAMLFSILLTLFDNLLQLPGIRPVRTQYKPRDNALDDPNHFDDYEEVE